jgi:DNA-binding MarR family transcriptional regulator
MITATNDAPIHLDPPSFEERWLVFSHMRIGLPMPAGDIAWRTKLMPHRIFVVLETLEADGLVTRHSSPHNEWRLCSDAA